MVNQDNEAASKSLINDDHEAKLGADPQSYITVTRSDNGDQTGKIITAESSRETWWSNFLLLTIFIISLSLLIYFIVLISRNGTSIVSGSVIGGKLSYVQAKGIDLACGAFLAPLLMLLLDKLWFNRARESAITDRKGRGIQLRSAIEASNTYQGSFDVSKFLNLTRGRTWTLSLFASLALLSGLSGKMFSNFIAYEAFNTNELSAHPATLRQIDSMLRFNAFGRLLDMQASANLSLSQQSDLATQMMAMLTSLDFKDATSNLDAEGGYIGTNATQASMNALDSSIVGLTKVPGYRLSVDCQPGKPNTFRASQMGETYSQFTIIFDCPTNKSSYSCGSLYTSMIPGISTVGSTTADNNEYAYIGFIVDQTYAWLGILDSFNYTASSPSVYGAVPASAINMTPSGYQSTKSIMTTWGLSCAILRQEGELNYTRQSNQSWTISGSSFLPEKNLTKSYLGDWQTILSYQAPVGGTIPGLGPALATTAGNVADGLAEGSTDASTFNWTIYALNYLYASGEAQRIPMEVLASNISTNPANFYQVSAVVAAQHYRIVYIPLILLLGLVTVLCAATATGVIVILTKDISVSQKGREQDTLRLLVDSVAGLQTEASALNEVVEMSQKDLERWADKFLVHYYKTIEDGHVLVRFGPVSENEEDNGLTMVDTSHIEEQIEP